jgi:23S rRNA (uracil1939-C5)-methyltransferase
MLEALEGAQLVIVDPPRKGLDAALTRALAARPPEELIYVSCGLQSFTSDLGLLLAGGRLRLAQLTAFNLLPFTEHVETVARFTSVKV